MSRSIKKGPFVQPKLLARVQAMNEKGEKIVLKTWSRSSTIFPDFVGHTFAVHDYAGGVGSCRFSCINASSSGGSAEPAETETER